MYMYSESYFDKYLKIHLLNLQNGTEEAKLCKTTTFNSRIKLVFSVLHIFFSLRLSVFARTLFFCVFFNENNLPTILLACHLHKIACRKKTPFPLHTTGYRVLPPYEKGAAPVERP